ncbi:MAG: hypothetical protein PHE55_00455 [Methylococcaceae bacterium]|nr:hypothetical protein [Methylococcaceae bacterium]
MTENVENLILEHLRHIRRRVDEIAEDMKDVKQRLHILEDGQTITRREVLLNEETSSRQQISIDRILNRLERVERRLDIINE